MKADGVTTMVLFTDAAMNKALMEQATQQDWNPEWFHTGNSFADYSTFAKTFPADQRERFFGISGSSPYVTPDTDPDTDDEGPARQHPRLVLGTQQLHVDRPPRERPRLADAGHPRGRPRADPQTFKQGQFSVPPATAPTHRRCRWSDMAARWASPTTSTTVARATC